MTNAIKSLQLDLSRARERAQIAENEVAFFSKVRLAQAILSDVNPSNLHSSIRDRCTEVLMEALGK